MKIGVLLLGFGGVTNTCCGRLETCPGRVECFVSKVLGDDPRMAARVAEVSEHYHHLGGISPYNELTDHQAGALAAALAARGHDMPVACGFRNWPPWMTDGLTDLRAAGCDAVIPVPLSAQVSSRGWDDYLTELHATAEDMADGPRILPAVAPYGIADGYAAACAAQIDQARREAGWSDERFAAAGLVLTAHAIPVPAERASPYRSHTEIIAAATAAACGHPEHVVAFQSAPDRSRVPWSEPRVEQVIADLAAAGTTDVVVQAVGFLVDHVEVVYDLDHEVADDCSEAGMTYLRAPCVHDHPRFISLLVDHVLAVATAD